MGQVSERGAVKIRSGAAPQELESEGSSSSTCHLNLNLPQRQIFSVHIKMPDRIKKDFMLSIPGSNF